MSECIKSKKGFTGYENKITEYLDRFLTHNQNSPYHYIYDEPFGPRWLIRMPGITVGNIYVENHKIKEITLYEDSFCYKEEVREGLKQFYGMKIEF